MNSSMDSLENSHTYDISATIIVQNEASRIERCLTSVQWMDDIVVVDSGSTDATCEIAKRYTDHVRHHNFDNFSAQKNYAADQARYDWIFSIDADEEITPELAGEIQQVITNNEARSCYAVPRDNIYFGHPVNRVMGFDAPIRLYRKSTSQFVGPVHEKVEGAEAGILENKLRHYSCEHYREWQTKHRTYLRMDAKRQFAAGRRCSLAHMLFSPLRVFLLRYIMFQGFKDGTAGFLIACEMAASTARYEGYLIRLGKR